MFEIPGQSRHALPGLEPPVITGSSRVPGVHGRGSAKVDTGIAPLLRELDRRADAVRVGQRCTTLDPAI